MATSRRDDAFHSGGAANGLQGLAEPLVVLWTQPYDGASHRVSPAQLRLLLILGRDGTLNLTALADRLAASPSSATRLCDRLVAAGLISRDTDRDDRRAVTLSLTRDGRRLLDELASRRELLLAQVTARMAPVDRDALRQGLAAFAAAFDSQRPDAASP